MISTRDGAVHRSGIGTSKAVANQRTTRRHPPTARTRRIGGTGIQRHTGNGNDYDVYFRTGKVIRPIYSYILLPLYLLCRLYSVQTKTFAALFDSYLIMCSPLIYFTFSFMDNSAPNMDSFN